MGCTMQRALGLGRVATRVARAPMRIQPSRLMSAEAEQYQSLKGRAPFFGSALEQPKDSYKNTIHEQDELWWDDGRAQREPIFDGDSIPLREAVSMFAGGFGLFASVAAIHFYLDPAENRPTVAREMPEAHIWERYGQGEAEAEEEEE